MALVLVTAPPAEPVTVAEMKTHLRIDHSDHDTYIATLIAAAREHLDGPFGILGRAIVEQTWDYYLDAFPVLSSLRMPLPSLISVGSVKYYDTDQVLQTLDSADYTVDAVSAPGWIVIGDGGWPSTYDMINAVIVRFTAGWASDSASPPDYGANVPETLKLAIKLMVAAQYGPSGGNEGMEKAAMALALPHRLSWF
jgi:uncharacterized phiE125 gp8 family phage protein